MTYFNFVLKSHFNICLLKHASPYTKTDGAGDLGAENNTTKSP